MLLSIFPVSFVHSTVWPTVDTVAMLLIRVKLALISFVLLEHVAPKAMHLRVFPLTSVNPAIFPLEDPKPMLHVVLPLSRELVTGLPYLDPSPVFGPFEIPTKVRGAV